MLYFLYMLGWIISLSLLYFVDLYHTVLCALDSVVNFLNLSPHTYYLILIHTTGQCNEKHSRYLVFIPFLLLSTKIFLPLSDISFEVLISPFHVGFVCWLNLQLFKKKKPWVIF